MQIFLKSSNNNKQNEKKAFSKEQSATPTGLIWNTNMAAVSLFGRRDVMRKRSVLKGEIEFKKLYSFQAQEY